MSEMLDFVTEGPVAQTTIEAFKDRVPEELVALWEQYGYGTFGSGFIRVIDPGEYGEALADCIGKVTGEGVAIPVMVTAMADLILWEPGEGLNVVLYRLGRTAGLANSVETFLKMVKRNGARYLEDAFAWKPFPAAVEKHGELSYDESFMFAPLLSLGGKPTVESLHKRETITGIQIMVEFQGPIEH